MVGNDLSLVAWKRVASGVPESLHGYVREWGEAVERLAKQPLADNASRLEWELWRSLCSALVESGAVLAGDMKRSVGDTSTPGCRLLRAIRAWGDARRTLAERAAQDDYYAAHNVAVQRRPGEEC